MHSSRHLPAPFAHALYPVFLLPNKNRTQTDLAFPRRRRCRERRCGPGHRQRHRVPRAKTPSATGAPPPPHAKPELTTPRKGEKKPETDEGCTCHQTSVIRRSRPAPFADYKVCGNEGKGGGVPWALFPIARWPLASRPIDRYRPDTVRMIAWVPPAQT